MKTPSTVSTPPGGTLPPCDYRIWAPPSSGDQMVSLILDQLCAKGDRRSRHFLDQSQLLCRRCPNCYWPISLIYAIADGKEIRVEERPHFIDDMPPSTTIIVDGALFARGSVLDAVLPNQAESHSYVSALAGFLREFNMEVARWRSLLHQRVWQREGWEPAGNLYRWVDLSVRVTTTGRPSLEMPPSWSQPALRLYERTKKEEVDRFFARLAPLHRALRDSRTSGRRLPASRVSVRIIFHDAMKTNRDEMTWTVPVLAPSSFEDCQHESRKVAKHVWRRARLFLDGGSEREGPSRVREKTKWQEHAGLLYDYFIAGKEVSYDSEELKKLGRGIGLRRPRGRPRQTS